MNRLPTHVLGDVRARPPGQSDEIDEGETFADQEPNIDPWPFLIRTALASIVLFVVLAMFGKTLLSLMRDSLVRLIWQ